MAFSVSPLTISAGTSLSALLDIPANSRIVRVGTPSGWDTAPLTFLVSLDGSTWLDVYRAAQTSEGMWQPYATGLQSVTPNSIVLLPSDAGLNLGQLKLRSGTRSQPINQAADRTFAIMFGD